jgi:hypothetical protein
MFSYYLLGLMIIKFTFCNIWDNFYSQLKSPQFILYPEFKLQLFKLNREILQVNFSSTYNSIKVSLSDPLLIAFLHAQEVYVDFLASTVSYESVNSCYYISAPKLGTFKSYFLLDSYDLFSYFRRDDVKGYYEYVVTNPLGSDVNFLAEANPLEPLLKDIDKDAFAIFRVNMKDLSLENVDLKYKGYEFFNLTTRVSIQEFNEIDFRPKNECLIYTPS